MNASNSFGVKSNHTSKDISTILQLLDEYKVHLFIDGLVSTGDITSWMLCKCWFNQFFRYYGVCLDGSELDPKVTEKIPFVPNAHLQNGICWSEALKKYITEIIEKQYHPAMFFCASGEREKLFRLGMEVLRPGDIIASSGFITEFSLGIVHGYVEDGKLKRLVKPWISPNIVVGIVQ